MLLLIVGETYSETRKKKHLYLIVEIVILGCLADYNFILLTPYVIFVLSSERSYWRRIIYLTGSLLLVWALSRLIKIGFYQGELVRCVYRLFEDFIYLHHVLSNLILYFNFEELLVGTLLVICLSFVGYVGWAWKARSSTLNASKLHLQIASWFTILMLIHFLIWKDYVRVRGVFAVVGLLVILAIWRISRSKFTECDPVNKRLVLSLMGSICLLLALNPLMHRELLEVRFLLALSPLVFFMIVRNLSPLMIRIFSVVLMMSGALYLLSASISTSYPIPDLGTSSPVIFEDEFAYADRYLRSDPKDRGEPFILDFSRFDAFCRVCRMGTDDIPYGSMDRFLVVTRHVEVTRLNIDPRQFIPLEYSLVSKYDALNWLDRIQFKYLTPMDRMHFVVWEFQK